MDHDPDDLFLNVSPQSLQRSVKALTLVEIGTVADVLSYRLGIDVEDAKYALLEGARAVNRTEVLDEDLRQAVFYTWDNDEVLDHVSDAARDQIMNALFENANDLHPVTEGLDPERAVVVKALQGPLRSLAVVAGDFPDLGTLDDVVEKIRDTFNNDPNDPFSSQDQEDEAVFTVISTMADPAHKSNDDALQAIIDRNPEVEAFLRMGARAAYEFMRDETPTL